jgi:uncharacterized protein DUF748
MHWPLRRRWPWITLAALVVLVLALDLALPTWIARYINGRLDHMGDYHGHLERVRLHLWRGAYSIEELRIARKGHASVPLLHAPRMDLSLSWDALLHGGVVGRVSFRSPEIDFLDAPATQNGKGVDWREKLEQLLPIRLDEVRVHDGTVRFRAFSTEPRVDVKATGVEGVVTNLTNVRDAGKRAATLHATARVLGSAPLETDARFDPLGTLEDFRFDLKVTGIDLTRANELLQAYAKLDVESGRGDFIMQLEARDRRLTGYAKPLFQHVKIFSWKQDIEQQHDNPFRALWEAVAGGVQNLFKNHQEDQFATRIEISGEIGRSETSTLKAIGAILHNAFVQALRPRFEDLPVRGPRERDEHG